MKFRTILVLSISIILISIGHAFATTYFVKPNGDDSKDGKSDSTAWRTISKANNTLLYGDIVNIRTGTYAEPIQPVNSGKQDQHITYQRYQTDTVTISGVLTAINIENKSYIKIDGIRVVEPKHFSVKTGNGDYNIIQNCHFEGGGAWSSIYISDGSDYNKILNNTITATCPCAGPCGRDYGGPSDLIQIYGGSYNLIQGNKLYYSDHIAIVVQARTGAAQYNIIRENLFDNKWHTNLSTGHGAKNTLIENNIIQNAGEEHLQNYCCHEEDRTKSREKHKSIQLNASYNIIRNNISINNGSFAPETWSGVGECNHNRIYNNTFFEDYHAIRTTSDQPHLDNIFKNNIFYNSKTYDLYHNAAQAVGFHYLSNNFYPGDNNKIAFSKIDDSRHWRNNSSLNPIFVDEINKNLTLSESSPLNNAGEFLTIITSTTGSGSSFTVEDASYFMDGWGIIDGDKIRLEGSNSIVRIIKISGNSISVDNKISWNQGDGISLTYNGSSPAIGAAIDTGFNAVGTDIIPPSKPANLRIDRIE
ncbi:MAG: hypothetical protein C4522_13925 [Desulfobacteraceae bacterium]|nr:MAG: hypothetical protein C4522_13925 [Desulfobacteraceae bacterium]